MILKLIKENKRLTEENAELKEIIVALVEKITEEKGNNERSSTEV